MVLQGILGNAGGPRVYPHPLVESAEPGYSHEVPLPFGGKFLFRSGRRWVVRKADGILIEAVSADGPFSRYGLANKWVVNDNDAPHRNWAEVDAGRAGRVFDRKLLRPGKDPNIFSENFGFSVQVRYDRVGNNIEVHHVNGVRHIATFRQPVAVGSDGSVVSVNHWFEGNRYFNEVPEVWYKSQDWIIVNGADVDVSNTAAWQAGIPAASGGNTAIETNTGNPGIAVNTAELMSGKGDAFDITDADGNTLKWTPQYDIDVDRARSSGGACSIAGGNLSESLPSQVTGAQDSEYGELSDFTIKHAIDGTQDWTIIINFANLVTSNNRVASSTRVNFCIGQAGAGPPFINLNNIAKIYLIISGSTPNYAWGWFIRDNGVTKAYSSTNINETLSGAFKITNEEGQITVFSGVGDPITWTQRASELCDSGNWPSTLLIAAWLSAYAGDQTPAISVNFKNFTLSTGSVASGTAASGVWTSPLRSTQPRAVGFRPGPITLAVSGLSATEKVSQVDILDSSGNVKYTFNNGGSGWTSGTSIVLSKLDTGSNLLPMIGGWKEKITLASGGAASPAVTSLTYNWEHLPPLPVNGIEDGRMTRPF